jgi:ribonuclease HI
LYRIVRGTWDEPTIRRICFVHDADAIMQIKLPHREIDDFVAWHGEANGVFSVRSAYRLGMQHKMFDLSSGQSSAEPDGDRRILDVIWKCPIPQKMRIFAWKLATDTLAVMTNVHRRINTVLPICTICGCAEEDAHHAVVNCTLAQALRSSMQKHWYLPSEAAMRKTGQEWAIQLLINSNESARVKLIFLWWRAWHHRNNVVHGDGKVSVAASVPYLVNYVESFAHPRVIPTDVKGKAVIHPIPPPLTPDLVRCSDWKPPPPGWIKVNVDAAWDTSTKRGGTGVIIRSDTGSVCLSAWEHLPECSSALEAELLACLHGLKQLGKLPYGPAILETDSALVLRSIMEHSADLSDCWTITREIKELLEFMNQVRVEKISRNGNGVAHSLGQLGRRELNGCLRDSAPPCVLALIEKDCTL